ncbi:MAG: hypothetical protein M1829_002356 [Trizodia sp. TS-e1964]|nr:MAG: hypothetical protein M1829_002356 [Trizodia sp. TS-e1964]
MSILRRIIAVVASAAAFIHIASAHSEGNGAISYLSLIENPIIHTPSRRVTPLSFFDLTFDLHDQRQHVKLSLEPNHDIIPEDASVQYLDAEGNMVRSEPIDRMAHKVFKGHAWLENSRGEWVNVGWSRIVVLRDGVLPLFEGAFTIMHDNHHIKMRSSYMSTKHHLDPHIHEDDDEYMVLFRDSDFIAPSHTELRRSDDIEAACHSDNLLFNIQPGHPVFSPPMPARRDAKHWGAMSTNSIFGKRQLDTTPSGGNSAGVNLRSSIGVTSGCPSSRKVALAGVAMDCTYLASFNESNTARTNVINQINTASALYESSFNITLGLRNVTLPADSACPVTPPAAMLWNTGCSANTTIQDRLNLFSRWRGTQNDSVNAYWTLLSTCNTGSAVGLAWLGQLCVNGVQSSQGSGGAAESVSGANVVVKTSTEWQVIAHETGHTFGAVHDCTSQTCNDGTTVNSQQCCPLSGTVCDAGAQYIMNPSTGSGIKKFSPCSIGNICSAIGRNSVNTGCLSVNKNIRLVSNNQCGNGIVEAGEDCDCGGTDTCGDNQCCDATTCKFKNNAQCDDSNEDCCTKCQFSPVNTVCRASSGECDPAETCSGRNATCPPDQKASDGQSCGNGTLSLTCASGQCTSRDQQCKTLMGSFTRGNDTYACDSSNCQLSCASPEFGANVCYGMQQNFLDGTQCGAGGSCRNGLCQGSSTVQEIGNFISKNKPLVIGIASAVGSLILLSIVLCIVRCCRRKRQPKIPMKPMGMNSGWQARAPPVPPPMPWAVPPMRTPTGGWGVAPPQQPGWQQPPPAYRPSVRYA